MNNNLQELAKKNGYEIRHYTTPLKKNESFEKVVRPFDFSTKKGGTTNAFKYYNDFYLYPIKK
jgi:hypothetical protein